MARHKLSEHPSIVHAAELIEICKPLEKLHNIDYFAHVNVDLKGNFTALGRNPAFVQHYISSKYYNHDIHVSKNDVLVDYVIQDNIQHFGATNQLFKDCEDFNLHHIFTIVHRNNSSVDAYHFATSQKDHKINEFYLRALPILKQFISYFKECTLKNKHLLRAYQHQFNIDKNLAIYESDIKLLHTNDNVREFINMIEPKRHLLFDNNNNYLTKRELECIIWLYFGKTVDDIAAILNISERTVRAHIVSIKQKLNCQTMFQLGSKITEAKIIDLIDYYAK